ncbi:MAG: hypothetical protein IIV99_02945, partial [Oscillospiraceae bacterium]|nr:hypothetical protein [Oscillospiraceae bacterium]
MQKINICKRILSAVLSLVIVLQMLPGGLTLTAFAADSLSKSSSQLALGMNIIPQHLSQDEVFLKNYVKVNGNAMNINKLFTKGETSNVKGADDNGGGIPTGTLKQNKSKFWYAEYIWNINETQKKYMLDENFRLVFEANVIPHYDKHLFLDDHWGTAYVRVTDGDWEPGRQDYGHERVRMFLQVSDNENSGEKQPVKNYWDHFWPLQSDGKVTYSAYYYGGMDCANPQVSGSTFYVVDRRNPRSNNSWMSYDIAGNNTLPSDVSLAGGDQKVYYHVSFDEAIRFSDNFREDKDVYVNVDAYYEHESGKVTDSAVKDSEQIKAKLVRIGENTLTFEFTVKQSLKDIYILGIDDSIFLSEHDLVLFDGNGKEFKGPSCTSSTWITDLAGNPLDGGFDSPYAYFDGVAPVLEAITISGKDINANSTKEPTDWTDNSVDRSAVFAGVGDKLTFEAHFSEDIYYNNLVAVLNIRDKNGNPVKLNIKKDYVTGDGKGKIVFKELKIAAGMVEPGTQIRIVSFENADTIKDAAGNYNKQNLSTVSVQTNQKQYLDIDKPKSTTNLTAQNGVYTAIAHENGNYFTFPLKFNEDVKAPNAKLTSGINDKEFKFSLAASDGGSYAFEYYIDTKQSINMDSKWKTAATGSKKYTYSKTSDNTQYYLHIKLDPNTNYGYTIVSDSTTGGNGIWFNGTISTEITDWAGNTGTASFKVKHQVDKVKPQATFTGNLSMTADYADAKATFNTDYSLTDNYAIASATYVWYTKIDGADSFTAGTPVVISDIGTGFVTGYNGAAEYIHNFDQSSDTGRKGEVYLEVTVADYAGNSYTTNSETVSFNFVKATGDYQVVTGSETAPLRIPSVTINTPKVPEGNQSENPARTVLFIPDTREGYEGCFWVYDPYNHVSDTTVYDSTEVFAFLDSYKTYYDEFPSGTEEYEKPINTFGKGAFHYIKGTLDQATETGTFTNIYKNMYMPGVLTNTDFDQFDFRYSLSKFIDDTYGTLDFYLVTSTSFPMVAGDGIAADNYNFIQSNSKVEKFTAYIANNADFKIETTDVILDGEECREELDYK